LLGREKAAVVHRHTENLQVHGLYLEGLYHWNKMTPESFAASLRCYEEALRIEPDFAPAHVGIGIWYLSQSFWAAISPLDGIPKTRDLATKALEIDEGDAVAHSLMGCIHSFFERDLEAGERSLRRAVELGPNVAMCHSNLALHLLLTGRLEESVTEARIASRLDPLTSNTCAWSGAWLARAGHFEEGVAEIRRAIGLHPDDWVPHHQLGEVLFLCRGLVEEAELEAEKAVETSGGASNAVTLRAMLLYVLGRNEEADELFRMLLDRSGLSYVPPSFIAQLHMARGETKEVLQMLEQAARDSDAWLVFFREWYEALPGRADEIDELLGRLGI
jgi:Flp pilus assembly protein TadD